MKKFERIKSIITPLPRINVDTDQMVPKQFLKIISRSGFGRYLFYGWRYADDGTTEIASFPLNDPRYAGSHILVTGENFGCGSSREHAAWALLDYGFYVVIAPSFADIFASNCIKSGVLPVRLSQDAVDELMETESHVVVDLESMRVTVPATGASWEFEIGEYEKKMLLEGLDEIDVTLEYGDEIAAFERVRQPSASP